MNVVLNDQRLDRNGLDGRMSARVGIGQGQACRLICGSFATLSDQGFAVDWLIDQMVEVMNEHPPAEINDPIDGSNDYGGSGRWDGIVRSQLALCYAVLKGGPEPKMLGYWHVMLITDELFIRAMNGENVNKELTEADVLLPTSEGNYSLYFVDLFTRSTATHHWTVGRLAIGFIALLKQWQRSGIYVKRMVAHPSELQGEIIAREAGFSPGKKHKYHRLYRVKGVAESGLKECVMHSIDLTSAATFKLFHWAKYAGDLKELYAEHFVSR
ncbi:MAG: hypothetical protein ACON4T_09155 [Synechococcus sp.]